MSRKSKDEGFRKWLIKKKNIEPAWLLTLGTKGTIMSYKREYTKSRKKRSR